MYPVKDVYITSAYGIHRKFGSSPHTGIDFRAATGTPLYAVTDGVVRVSKFNRGGYGWYVVIEHDGACSLYAHLSERGLLVGTVVKEGDVIGKSGNTGSSTGPHLHYEVRLCKYANFWNTLHSDPIEFLEGLNDVTEDRVKEIVKEILRGEKTTVSPWAKKELLAAVEAGVTDGKNPGGYCTREEAAIMALRSNK